MPTVHTAADDTPPILVVLYADAIEPDASVAPEGAVRFTVLNRADEPRDFIVAIGGETAHRSTVGPNDSADVTLQLPAGTHLLGTAPPHATQTSFAAVEEITVQPADTYDVTATPVERREDPTGTGR